MGRRRKPQRQQQGEDPADDGSDDDVDYALAADAHAADRSDDDNNDDDNNDDDDDDDGQGGSESSSSSDEDDGDDGGQKQQEEEDGVTSSSDEEMDDEGDGDGLEGEGSEDDDESGEDGRQTGMTNDDDDVDDDDDDNNDEIQGERCTFDLRNLLAVNSHQINEAALFRHSSSLKKSAGPCTIEPPAGLPIANESHLLQKASEGATQLLKALWKLPTERSDAGPIATLPADFDVRTPRALPPPPPKKESKWEKFAKERGIGLNKEKRSRKVWDEATGQWLYRHGYQKANSDGLDWPILEVKGNDDPYADPWEAIRSAKKQRVEKNATNRMRNAERSGRLEKGTATRLEKERTKVREKQQQQRRHATAPGGVPVDLSADKTKRGKALTKEALVATQRSTASLGKFDKMGEGEPERKAGSAAAAKKRKREGGSNTNKALMRDEADRSKKILERVMTGGGSAKERAVRKGDYAKGETAYDYDFDDGLGASSFRKKKGRAGAGKMRKVTKKRIK